MQTYSLLLAAAAAAAGGGGVWGVLVGESGKINGHSGGRHKGLLKVYCHKH